MTFELHFRPKICKARATRLVKMHEAPLNSRRHTFSRQHESARNSTRPDLDRHAPFSSVPRLEENMVTPRTLAKLSALLRSVACKKAVGWV